MSEKRFERWNDHSCKVKDNQEDTFMNWEDVVKKLNEQQVTIDELNQENADLLGAMIRAQEEWEKCTDKLKAKILEQQATISALKEENDKLRGLIKENVFGMYNEGSLADLEFKATAYDDIIKVKLSDESEPKVIVICKQGKKENIKSFCQFIPFGVYYEIKELENE